MSENTPERAQDPINPDEADWEEAGLPAQEDATEDTALPTGREGPAPMGGTAGPYASEGGRSLDDAMAEEVPEPPEAGGSAAPTEQEDLGWDRGERRSAHSAEEQAVHERAEEGR